MDKSKSKLFRQQSVDALSTPDRIDEYIRVTSGSTYIVLTALLICCAAAFMWLIYGTVTEQVKMSGVIFPHKGVTNVITPNEGLVSGVYAPRGRYVQQGEPLLRISRDGISGVVNAPVSGIVLSYKNENESFKPYESIVYLMSQEGERMNKELITYVSFKDLRKLKLGQEVQATPGDLRREEYGYMTGRIEAIDTYPVTKEEVAERLKLPQFANEVFPEGTAYEVKILLDSDSRHLDKVHWSRRKSRDIQVAVGTFCNLQIITRRRPVYELVLKKTEDLIYNIKNQ